MLQPEEFKAAVKGHVTCKVTNAATLLEHLVKRRLAGVSYNALDDGAEQFAENHTISADDLDFIRGKAESIAVAQGASVCPVTISAADLYAKEIEPPTWIIEGVLPAGLTILAGNPKAGKSWLALDLAIAAASGGALFDELDCEKSRDVLYLALEDTDYRLQYRMKRLLAGGQPPSQLEFSTAWPRADQGGLNHLSEWVQAHENAGLIIIDTLQMIRPEGKKNGSIYQEDYKAISILKKLADDHKIAVVIVHHLRKAKSDDVFEKISGSFGLTGASDTNCVLERDTSTSNATLHIRGRDVGDITFALLFDKNLGRWRLLGECELPATQQQQDIVAIIKDKALKPSDIAELLGTSAKSVSNTLTKLCKKGVVVKKGYGHYISAMYELEQEV